MLKLIALVAALEDLSNEKTAHYISIRPEIQDLLNMLTVTPNLILTQCANGALRPNQVKNWAKVNENPIAASVTRQTLIAAEAAIEKNIPHTDFKTTWDTMRPIWITMLALQNN